MSPIQSGLGTFPEAIGVMIGAQLASHLIYPRLGARWHVTLGLISVAGSIGLLAVLDESSSLWWARGLLFVIGVAIAQVFVPTQVVAFAGISPRETGAASTMFNAVRQLGGAVGVAVLTTVIVGVGPVHVVHGHTEANLTAYRVTFVVAAAIALLAVASSLAPARHPRAGGARALDGRDGLVQTH